MLIKWKETRGAEGEGQQGGKLRKEEANDRQDGKKYSEEQKKRFIWQNSSQEKSNLIPPGLNSFWLMAVTKKEKRKKKKEKEKKKKRIRSENLTDSFTIAARSGKMNERTFL